MNKKYNYDKKSGSLFAYLEKGEEESYEKIAPGINIELGKDNKIIGAGILKASRFLGRLKEPIIEKD